MKIFSLWLMAAVFWTAGCTSVATRTEANVDLRKFKRVHVITANNDNYQLDRMIAAELTKLGYEATSGVATMMPDNAQLMIGYDSQVEWDFRLYLIKLNIVVRDARSEKELAQAAIFHPGVTSKSPEKMVAEMLAPLFGPKPPAK